MKKSKILLVTVLALVLCLLCVTTSTFSWLPRPKEDKGNSLGWNPSYEASVGKDITMTTYELPENGREPDDPHAVLDVVSDFNNNEGIDPGQRKYYRTDIINSGKEAQSVSLFLSSLRGLDSTNGKFCLGVNGPLRTYKNYSDINSEAGSKVEKVINEQYVYLGLHAGEETEGKFNNKIERIHAWNDSISLISKSNWSDRLSTGKTGKWSISDKWENEEQTFNIYAMKVDYRCTDFQLKEPGAENFGWHNEAKPKIAENNTLLFYFYDNAYTTVAKNSSEAAGIESFYSSAGANVGDTVNLAATGHTDTFTYTSSDESVATVNSSGQVTAKKAGHTSIILTSTGAYGDKITAACWLTVHDSADPGAIFDVPIVTNVKVAPATEAGNTVESVYWYIKNDGSVALTYSIGDIYLTL